MSSREAPQRYSSCTPGSPVPTENADVYAFLYAVAVGVPLDDIRIVLALGYESRGLSQD